MDRKFKKFTLEDANALLPRLIDVTERTKNQLESLRQKQSTNYVNNDNLSVKEIQNEIDALLENWVCTVTSFGVIPKGFFTCDFISPNPDTYFCWSQGETSVIYTHKIYETFKDRVVIEEPKFQGFDFSVN